MSPCRLFVQVGIVLYELPPSADGSWDLQWVHELVDKWALFLTRLIGRGCFYIFVGTLTAAKFSESSFFQACVLHGHMHGHGHVHGRERMQGHGHVYRTSTCA